MSAKVFTVELLVYYYTIVYKSLISLCFLGQLAKSARDVSKFASIATVDIDSEDVQVYVKYFDITLIPSTIFFFNAHHMKMDSGYVCYLCCINIIVQVLVLFNLDGSILYLVLL